MKLTLIYASIVSVLAMPILASATAGNASHGAAKIPLALKRVSLSSSGVGYFEYEASVTGDAILSLPVALDKVDDVLKSLVVYDAQGRIGGISLPGLDPITQTMKQLPFDASALQSPEKLLDALRGAEISVLAKTPMRGRIVSVKPIEATDKEPLKHQVLLMTAQGLQQFILETADSIQFEEPALREQIQTTLAALANNRAKDSRTIEIISQGNSSRRVRVGYVSSVPIWKNAYRLTVPNSSAAGAAQVQGWAVIENMTGQDWTDVQLSLTSGKPVAFSQQLYKSYYNTRPHVGVELPGNVMPIADGGAFEMPYTKNVVERAMPMPVAAMPAPKLLRSSAAMVANDAEASPQLMAAADDLTSAGNVAMIDANTTQTNYTFELPVSVGSGRSLSIPIIQSELPFTRTALYQPSVHAQFPLAAIELSNSSANTMPAGAVTVYEASNNGYQFIGDAQLKVLPANDKRYIAYALDQKMSINQRDDLVYAVKRYAVKGAYLHTEFAQTHAAIFTLKSNHLEPSEVVVEVPIQGEQWMLVNSEAHTNIGKTASHYRQKIIALPQKTTEVAVRQLYSNTDIQPLNGLSLDALREVLNKVKYPTPHPIELSPDSQFILETVIALIEKRDALAAQQQAVQAQLQVVRENQQRIRDNLKSVPVKSEPHNRYMNELNKVDAQDSALQTELGDIRLKQQAQEKLLQEYFARLK
jgi:hypothetical protein